MSDPKPQGLSFSDWQAARANCADTGLQIGEEASGLSGYVYPGDCVIDYTNDGEYLLTISNQNWGGEDLPRLERILWAVHYLAEHPRSLDSHDLVAFALGQAESRNLEEAPRGLTAALLDAITHGVGLKSTNAYRAVEKFFSLKFEATGRGFAIAKFKDRYGVECSLQASSLATESCVWLGPSGPNPKILVEGRGWEEFWLPQNVSVTTRMHLTQQMVRDLLPALQHFAETGELPNGV